ncbi:MAG: O-succinylhomoserine sulfhydrylase [Pseudomonadota bacterium]
MLKRPDDIDHGALRRNADTEAVHAGIERTGFGETSEALFLTSGFVYDTAEAAEARFKGEADGYVYSRYGNPTVATFEQRMAALEGAETARAAASGMAAIQAALMGLLKAGDHVVSAKQLFGSCRYLVEDLLPRFGVSSTLVDGTDLDQWRKAMRPETKLAFLETPTNPMLRVLDIAAISAIAHDNGAVVLVDNVFGTPVLQKPLQHGADLVVYSATKHIDGQGRCLGGIVLGSEDLVGIGLKDFLRHTGPALSPFNAWVLLKGLETLSLRVERQSGSAARIADHLAETDTVARVLYPGRDDHPDHDLAKRQMQAGGTLIAFDVTGGKAGAFRFLNALRLVSISNNLGDAKTLATHPATTTHQRLSPEERAAAGITDATVRLSAGLEAADDLISDVAQALEAARV